MSTEGTAYTIEARTKDDWESQPGYKRGHAAGLREGARRERRALKKWALAQETWFGVLDVKDWVESRAKRDRRKK